MCHTFEHANAGKECSTVCTPTASVTSDDDLKRQAYSDIQELTRQPRKPRPKIAKGDSYTLLTVGFQKGSPPRMSADTSGT